MSLSLLGSLPGQERQMASLYPDNREPGLLFAVSWAGQDNLTGVSGYDVENKLGAGSWTRWLTGTLETEAEFSGAVTQSYTFRVRAVDRVGNVSAWVESSSVAVQTVTKYYTFGGRRIAERQGSAVYYLHGDHLGSVSLVTSSTGQVISQSRYLPYGEIRWTGGAKTTDISYTGQRADSFGLMDYRARYYSPKLGRFILPDSIIPQASQGTQAWDRYAGMNNNPVKYNDPSGQDVGCGGQDCSVAKPSKQQPNEDDGWCMNAGNERWCSGTVESNWEWAKWNFDAFKNEISQFAKGADTIKSVTDPALDIFEHLGEGPKMSPGVGFGIDALIQLGMDADEQFDLDTRLERASAKGLTGAAQSYISISVASAAAEAVAAPTFEVALVTGPQTLLVIPATWGATYLVTNFILSIPGNWLVEQIR